MQSAQTIFTLIQYLKHSRQIFAQLENGAAQLNLIMGNQTADMDSCVGSLLLAYYLQHIDREQYYIPLINEERKKFSSHFDVIHLLGQAINEILFLDDIHFNKLTGEQLNIILYDHNIPEGSWKHLKNRVNKIVDHHEDKTIGYYTQHIHKDIQTVGSAISLVAQYYKRNAKELVDAEIAKMFCTTIIIDTFNFDMAQKDIRWTQIDIDSFNFIKQYDENINQQEIYKFYSDLKYSEEMNLNLDFEDLLLKDYKEFLYKGGLCGYAVIFLKLTDLQRKYNLCEIQQHFFQFKNHRQLKTLVVFFVHLNNDKLEREVLILDDKKENLKYQKIKQNSSIEIELLENKKLKIEKLFIQFETPYVFFRDTQAIYTRKTFEPILSAIL